MAHAALSIAKFFLAIPDKDSGELISNLKIQKLLYYAQGYHVALHGVARPLFTDRLYAWKHGPVVKNVYNHYASYKSGALPQAKFVTAMEPNTREFLNEIYRTYGKYSAWALREMTHREAPWLKNYNSDELDIEIPLSDLHSFFSKYVKKETRKSASKV
jgi:uncharacterized phage-associated protein